MAIHASYSSARANFSQLLNEVSDNSEIVVIERRGTDPVAMIAMSELNGLMETAHLLRSPANAKRLLAAIKRAQSRTLKPHSLSTLTKRVGLNEVLLQRRGIST